MKALLPQAVVIAGPTASGKTDLAVELVNTGRFEIISVDSALVYKGMDIGTAKPDSQTLAVAPHRLIDICEPQQAYSAAAFVHDALKAMKDITAQGKIPLLVGGTMLYLRALQYGLSDLPESSPLIRQQLQQQLDQYGSEKLHQRLQQVDPLISQRIHRNDPQRIIRALEVFELTGQRLSELQARDGQQVLDYQLYKFALAPQQRTVLHERIALRFEQMLKQGFEQEVVRLMQLPDMHADLPSMRSVGYRQMLMYLNGEYDKTEMQQRGVIATRQLAKRQFTWLRADSQYQWLDSLAKNNAVKLLQSIEKNNK